MGHDASSTEPIGQPGAKMLNRRRVLRWSGRLAVALPALAAAAVLPRSGGARLPAGGAHPSAAPADAACAATPAASPEAAATVRMTDRLRFDPPEVTIGLGRTVTWVNASAIPHTATGDPAQNPLDATRPELVRLPEGAEPWGSELLRQGDTFSHTFTVPGRYEYICIPHVLSEMRGVIVVECDQEG